MGSDVPAQIEGEIIKEVVTPENPQLPKQIKTGIGECLAKLKFSLLYILRVGAYTLVIFFFFSEEVTFGSGVVRNVIPQAVAQTKETTDECPAGGVLTPTDPPAEITCKNFLHPTLGGVLDDRFLAPACSNTLPMGDIPQGMPISFFLTFVL